MAPTPNSISFPTTVPSLASSQSSAAEASALSLAHHRTAADACELFYGASPPAWQAVERFYDPHATYENPFVTATSKDTISDVHALAHTLSQLDVPKPWAVLRALFRLAPGDGGARFDGHKRTMVEHTLHILVLPGLHSVSPGQTPPSHSPASEAMMSLLPADHTSHPSLQFQHSNISLWPPSPFHLKLPIITRLSFNDAGKITHHRDFWDVKDLLGLVPGMTLVQWVSGRLAAQSIRGIVRVGRALLRSSAPDEEAGVPGETNAVDRRKQQHLILPQ